MAPLLDGRVPTRPEVRGEAAGDVQNWIGGWSPAQAAFVPPPPELVQPLMEDLVAYANRTNLPAVVQAGVLHAQFETIHPFADGNGRVGRALIGWCLRRRGLAEGALPPLSPVWVRQVGAYVAGLHDFREGRLDRWVSWFAEACVEAAAHLSRLAEGVERVLQEWESQTSALRSDAAAVRVLPLLAERGAVDVRLVAKHLGVSANSVRNGMSTLERLGIVERTYVQVGGRGQRPVAWVAPAILRLLD